MPTLENNTDSTIELVDTVPERSFDIVVKDSEGVSLSLTKEGRRRRYPDITMARDGGFLKSREKIKFRSINLNRLFDLSRAAKYTVEVQRIYYIRDTKNNEVSNDHIISSKVIKFKLKI